MKKNQIINGLGCFGLAHCPSGDFDHHCGKFLKQPSFEQVKASYQKSDAQLLDRYGRIIHEMRIESKGRRLEWIDLRAVSPALSPGGPLCGRPPILPASGR